MTKAFDGALRLLARREHGMRELLGKLLQKGYDRAESEAAVAECQRLGYQDDARFAESFCRARVRQGYGPLRISQELQGKQLDREIITEALQHYEPWEEYARAVFEKKYRHAATPDFAGVQKQQRFLLYRGFPAEMIAKIIHAVNY